MNEEVLIQGNAAIAESAIRAGCRYYFGYPITPSSEIAEYFAARAGQNGITYLQAETEIAAFNMVAGVAAAGRIAMTGHLRAPAFVWEWKQFPLWPAHSCRQLSWIVCAPGPAMERS